MDRNFGKNLELASAISEKQTLAKKLQELRERLYISLAENKESRAKLEEIKTEFDEVADSPDLSDEQREFIVSELLRTEFELRNKKIDSSDAISQISSTIHKVNKAITNSEIKITNITADSYHKNKKMLN